MSILLSMIPCHSLRDARLYLVLGFIDFKGLGFEGVGLGLKDFGFKF